MSESTYAQELKKIFSHISEQFQWWFVWSGPEMSEKGVKNCSTLVDSDSNIRGKVYKQILTGLEDEYALVSDSGAIQVFETPFGRLGIANCLDGFMDTYRQELYNLGAEIITMPSTIVIPAPERSLCPFEGVKKEYSVQFLLPEKGTTVYKVDE